MAFILSVDDSKTIGRVIGGTVEMLGYELLEAMDGLEALSVLADHVEDTVLVLMDVNMPNMDGFTCLERIKADPALQHLPVIMVTTEAERKNIVRAIRAGAANYITKPFTTEDLSTKILDTLNQ